MGKIYDALEKRKKEKFTKLENLHTTRAEKTVTDNREVSLAKEICQITDCSPKVVVISAPDSLDAESFRILRTRILFSRNGERPRAIMVTSPFAGEGKTFVAVNMAASIALGIDEHVLLVDCDLRHPQTHEMLGLKNSKGLCEYLTGGIRLEELIIPTQIDKLSVLPAGTPPSNPTELLSSRMMEECLAEVAERYQDRFIILDSTPSQVTAETKVLANYVDGIVLVVMALKSPLKAVEKTIQDIGKEKILGVVFNGYSGAYKDYYKYYQKYYGAQ